MAKQIIKRGSIVLVRYPFSDLSSTKVRPAVILTPNEMLLEIDDLLCLFISSSIPSKKLPTDLIVKTTHSSFKNTGLKFQSVFRAHKIALLHKSLVFRALGEADEKIMKKINQKLRIALGL